MVAIVVPVTFLSIFVTVCAASDDSALRIGPRSGRRIVAAVATYISSHSWPLMAMEKPKPPNRLGTAARFIGTLAALAEAIAHLIKAVGGL